MDTDARTVDADDASFAQRVVEESRRRPVVVDFWAEWCAPCRVLGPVLERLAEEGGGRWLLAKVDVDRSPEIAARLGIRGIPAVKAFVGGEVVSELVGALPEGELRDWLDEVVPGPEAEEVARGESLAAAGEGAGARAAFERALAHRPRHAGALLGLARLDADAGDFVAATRDLDLIPAADQERLAPAIGELRLRLSAPAGGLEAARAAVAAAPGDDGARLALGRALAAGGRHEEALETLLSVVAKLGRTGAGEDARLAMLEVFEAVGSRSELADRFRSRLAAELYR